jgi:hypothetical protein
MKRVLIAIGLIILFAGCGGAEWAGRYKSAGCMTLEYVEFYQDNTADIKYFGAKFATNHKMTRKDNHFFVNIYKFELREDGKMYEEGGYDIGCVLVKDEKHGFWDKILQP